MTYNARHYINACSKITIVSSGYSVLSLRSWTQYNNTASCFAVRVKKEIIHANHRTPPPPLPGRSLPRRICDSRRVWGTNSLTGWVTVWAGGRGVEGLRNLEPLCSARRETIRMRARKNVSAAVPISSTRICQQSRLSLVSSDTRSISSPRIPRGWFLHANDRNSPSVRNWLRHDPRTLKVSAWVAVFARQFGWVRWFKGGGREAACTPCRI